MHEGKCFSNVEICIKKSNSQVFKTEKVLPGIAAERCEAEGGVLSGIQNQEELDYITSRYLLFFNSRRCKVKKLYAHRGETHFGGIQIFSRTILAGIQFSPENI